MKTKTGTIKFFDENRGYGFIADDEAGSPDQFVHIRQVERSGISAIARGDRVEYQVWTNDRNGKTEATDLRILCGSEAREARQ